MPSIWLFTTWPPFSAAASDCCATFADVVAVCATSLIDCAICSTDADACWISLFWRCDASNSRFEIDCVSCVALVTWSVAELMPLTSVRSSSIVKLIESAIAPVTSSVTDAVTVRSPSARLPISFSSRRIASWLRLFSCSLSVARTRESSRYTLPIATSVPSASTPKRIAAIERDRALGAAALVRRRKRRGFLQQRLGLVVDRLRALLRDRQALHVRQDRVDARFVDGEALLQLVQRRARFLVADRA